MTGFQEETLSLPDGDVAYLTRAGQPDAGTLIFAHANGLNAGAYLPMLAALSGPRGVIALDMRGHGRTRLPAEPAALTQWTLYAEDLVRILRALAPGGPLVLAGHSMGAVSMLLAADLGLAAERLVMIEPVILPRAARLIARSPLRGPIIERRGIAARAAKRRDGWPDAAAARAQYAGTAFFKDWPDKALDGYLARGLMPAEDGVRLSCAPPWEAASFAAQGHRFWAPLARVAGQMPTHVLGARGRTTVPTSALARLVRSGARLTQMEGGHMLPAERPADVAAYLMMTFAGQGV